MTKAFILDDEVQAIALLRKYISQIDFIELVSTSRNSMNAFSYLQSNEIDVLFLDIDMPILSGLELYKTIKKKPKVIFTTAYPEYAVEGFDLDAIDYLVKPITLPRFLKACEKLHRNLSLDERLNDSSPKILSDTVFLKSGSTTHRISWKDVQYLEKDENYVVYVMKDKRILCRATLTNLENLFPPYIVRIHQSYAVSLLHVSQITRTHLNVLGANLPIGRRYRKNIDSNEIGF